MAEPFQIDPVDKKRNKVGRLNCTFLPSSDTDMIEDVRHLAEINNVTSTEIVRQMVNYCLKQMKLKGEL